MKTRHFEHSFLVKAPLHRVVDFHSRPENMKLLMPPFLMMRFDETPPQLTEGSKLSFKIGVGPLSVGWVAEIDQFTTHGFIDSQVLGPFAKWLHRHDFVSAGDHVTEVRDWIEAEFSRSWKNLFLGFTIWHTLPLLFLFRSWATKRALERRPA